MIFDLNCINDDKEPCQVLPEGTCQRNNESRHQLRGSGFPVLEQDLNCLPYPDTPSDSSDDQQIEQSSSGFTLIAIYSYLLWQKGESEIGLISKCC